jgi:hypothetical protein
MILIMIMITMKMKRCKMLVAMMMREKDGGVKTRTWMMTKTSMMTLLGK